MATCQNTVAVNSQMQERHFTADDMSIQRADVLCHLSSVDTGMVVIEQVLEECEPLGLKLLCSGKDLVHILHILGIVRVELIE